MNAVNQIIAELKARGVRIEPRPRGGVRLAPARLVDASLLQRIQAHKADLLAYVRAEQEERRIDRLATIDGWKPMPPAGAPAYSILETCRRYRIKLSIDPENGDLLVGNDEPGAAQPWPSLMMALEAHVKAVAALVAAGWHLKAGVEHHTAA